MEHETPSTSFADQPAATVAGAPTLSPSDVAAAPGTLRVIQAQRCGRDIRRRQNPDRAHQGVSRSRGRHGGRLVPHPRHGGNTDRPSDQHVPTAPPVWRHHPHRGDPGPGRAGPHALRRAQGSARLRALPRGTRTHPRRQRDHRGRSKRRNPGEEIHVVTRDGRPQAPGHRPHAHAGDRSLAKR